MSEAMTLRQAIASKGLQYKYVAGLVGCTPEHVCADASKLRISVERAILYCRALELDPALLRPDVFKLGEVKFLND